MKKIKCISLREVFTKPKLVGNFKVTTKEMKYIRKYGGMRQRWAKRIKKRGKC